MAKTPEWHEQLATIIERRARLVSEIRRSRTLSAETRKMAIKAVEEDCFAAAQRVFPKPVSLQVYNTPQTISATTSPVVWGHGNA